METQLHKFTVEVLTPDDLKWFVETAAVRMLTDELKRPELIDLNTLYALSQKGMEGGTAFIAKKGYEPVGALGALLVSNVYNNNIKTLAEMFWYVLPEYRETRAGAMLFSAFDSKGKECADESVLSLLGSSTINMKTLEKRGFLLGEFAFRKEYRST